MLILSTPQNYKIAAYITVCFTKRAKKQPNSGEFARLEAIQIKSDTPGLTTSNPRFASSCLVHHPPVSKTRPPIYPTRHRVGLDTLVTV